MNTPQDARLPSEQIREYIARENFPDLPTAELDNFKRLVRDCEFAELLDAASFAKTLNNQRATNLLYLLWVEKTDAPPALLSAAWFNLGAELSGAGDAASSITAYQNALALKETLYQASVNLGLQFERLGQTNLALETWQRALQPDEARTQLLNHLGRLLEREKRFEEAERALFASLLTSPDQPDAIQHWVHLRQRMCDWPVYGNGIPRRAQSDLTEATSAFALMAMHDDLALQNDVAERWIARKIPAAPRHLSPKNGYDHDKLKIGYLSSDYCEHPISYLLAELFETHNRERFEVYGYCSGKEDGSQTRQRIIASFDEFKSIAHLNDEDAAQVIRKDEIDILVDLNGLTLGARLGALRWRPAPVQMTYLGYIGSVPLPELDYLLCDAYVVPPEIAGQYHPTPLYLPRHYQANDSKLPIAPLETRAEAGLPDDKFVFCCFSNNYKITEEVFEAWLSVLSQVENSVLWLLADNQWSRKNLLARAQSRGIAAERLIFAQRVSPAQYRSRLALADLFLDTFPYNAGTTASDALRVGLPLITRSGQTFCSRMAGSLLRAVGLPEAVVETLDDYIKLAVELGQDERKYKEFRNKVSGDSWQRCLGNTDVFAAELEALYASVARRPTSRTD